MSERVRKIRAVARMPAGTALGRTRAGATAAEPPPGTVETGELLRILKARRWTIIVATLLFTLAGTGIAVVMRPLYTSSAQILIDTRGRQLVDRGLVSEAPAFDSGVLEVESQARLIGSNSVLERTIGKLDLLNDPEFGASSVRAGPLSWLQHLLGQRPTPPSPDDPVAVAESLRALRRRLAVLRDDKTSVVNISVSSSRPVAAMQIAGAIADSYMLEVAAARQRAERDAAAAVSSQLEELHRRTQDAETELERYKASAGFVGSNGLPVVDAQLAAANTDVSAAQTRLDAAQARLDQAKAMQSAGLLAPSAGDGTATVLSQLRTAAAAQADALARLRATAGPGHPAVIAAEAALARARGEIRMEVFRLSRTAAADVERARAELAAALGRLDTAKAQSAKLNGRGVRLRELQREADASRTVYQSFLTRAGELSAQAGVDAASSRIVSRPLLPLQPNWPRYAIVIAAFVAGLAFGTAWALIREYFRPTILSLGNLKQSSGARLIGSVASATLRDVGPAADVVDLRDAATSAMLLRIVRRRSRAGAHGRARCIGVISLPEQRGDRSNLVTLLAATAARQGLRVVVVGTAERNAHESSGRPALASPSSGAPGRVTRLSAGIDAAFSSPARAADMLVRLHEQFDLVIADLNNLVGSVSAASIAAASDDMVVVAREGRSDRAALTDLAQLADASGTPVTAAVLVSESGRR